MAITEESLMKRLLTGVWAALGNPLRDFAAPGLGALRSLRSREGSSVAGGEGPCCRSCDYS